MKKSSTLPPPSGRRCRPLAAIVETDRQPGAYARPPASIVHSSLPARGAPTHAPQATIDKAAALLIARPSRRHACGAVWAVVVLARLRHSAKNWRFSQNIDRSPPQRVGRSSDPRALPFIGFGGSPPSRALFPPQGASLNPPLFFRGRDPRTRHA